MHLSGRTSQRELFYDSLVQLADQTKILTGLKFWLVYFISYVQLADPMEILIGGSINHMT